MDFNTSSTNKTTLMTRKYTIEKHNEKIDRMWKWMMSLILEREQLIDIVKGVIPQPTTIPEFIDWKLKI